jgi:hypothetical protein
MELPYTLAARDEFASFAASKQPLSSPLPMLIFAACETR